MALRKLVALACVVLGTAACTPEQITAYIDITNPATQAAERKGLNDHTLHRLRQCESGDRWDAVSRSGRYRGAYQFSRSTWDATARRHYPWLQGADPAATEPWWQDAMTRALWSERGPQPWPHCGRIALG